MVGRCASCRKGIKDSGRRGWMLTTLLSNGDLRK
jgi:hypothetical protein